MALHTKGLHSCRPLAYRVTLFPLLDVAISLSRSAPTMHPLSLEAGSIDRHDAQLAGIALVGGVRQPRLAGFR